MTASTRFTGASRLQTLALGVGALGFLLSLVGMVMSPDAAFKSYLVSFAYWFGIAFGALVLLMANLAARAKWVVVIRRVTEAMTATFPLFALLFIPIFVGRQHVFPWINPVGLDDEHARILAGKQPYLNVGFFAVRCVLYFLILIFVAEKLHRESVAQDENGLADHTRAMRKWAAGALPIVALAFSFAGFDWVMSTDPFYFSTLFGVYYFAGSFIAAISLLTILVIAARRQEDGFGRYVTLAHQHNLGKYMLAFTAFWAYIAFDQWMLTWVANLPEEIPWYQLRSTGQWHPVGLFLIVFHFAIPFLLLLSKDLKLKPSALTAMAIWMMAVHYVDLYWVLMPVRGMEGYGFHWTHVTSFVGIGGLALGFGLMRLRGKQAMPIRDPYLEDSLRYTQP